jgi:hypothetical protein
MDVLSSLATIEATVGRVQRVRDLTLGSQMTAVLESVGSRHLDAALMALRDARHSTQPSARINSAVNSLIEAYTHITPFRQPGWVRFVRGGMLGSSDTIPHEELDRIENVRGALEAIRNAALG